MKLIAVLVLAALVAVASARSHRFPKNAVQQLASLKAARSVSQETLDLAFNMIVTMFHTVEATYPPELLQEVISEILANDGAFNFSPELRTKLDGKRVELSINLKVALEQLIVGENEVPEDVLEKIRSYVDFAVDTVLQLTPYDLMEEITKEVLKNGGSFDFSPELLAMIDDIKAAYKEASRRLLDYEFEVFDDLIDISDELRQKIYQAVDYIVDRNFETIPWKLLEDIVYYILRTEGSIDLTTDLYERIDATKEEMIEKLRETLDTVDEMLNGGLKRLFRKTPRIVSDETMEMIYINIITVIQTAEEVISPELLQETVSEILANEGSFDFSSELSDKIDAAVEQFRVELKEKLLSITSNNPMVQELGDDAIEKLRKYFDYSVDLLIELFPTELVEEITKEVLRNGGSFVFSPELEALIAESLQKSKLGLNALFDYEFEIFPELAELSDAMIEGVHGAIDSIVDGVYAIFPWELMEEIMFEVLSKDGVIDLSPELVAKIQSTLEQLGVQLRALMDKVTDAFPEPK